MLNRIWVEDCNNDKLVIDTFASYGIENLSIIKATGVYKGVKEASLCIEVAGNEDIDAKLKSICIELKRVFKQECILVERIESSSSLV